MLRIHKDQVDKSIYLYFSKIKFYICCEEVKLNWVKENINTRIQGSIRGIKLVQKYSQIKVKESTVL